MTSPCPYSNQAAGFGHEGAGLSPPHLPLLRGARTHSAAPPGMTIIFLFFFVLPTNTKWSQTGSIAFYVEEDDDSRLPKKKTQKTVGKGSLRLPHSEPSFAVLPFVRVSPRADKMGGEKIRRDRLSDTADTLWEKNTHAQPSHH